MPNIMNVVKHVLDVLQSVSPNMLTGAEILERTGFDLTRDVEAGVAVATNPKVRYQPPPSAGEHAGDASYAAYGFKSAFPEVGNAQQLADLVTVRTTGTSVKELSECYPQARQDALQLVEDGVAWLVANGDSGDKTIYPRDKKYETATVSQRVRDIWLRMEVPTDPGAVAAELQRAGIKPAKRKPWDRKAKGSAGAGAGEGGEQKKKRKRDFSRLHVTNVHLFDELLAPGSQADFDMDDD